MIVQTKYRDIPWSEAQKCFALMPPPSMGTPEQVWEMIRNSPIAIVTPATPKTSGDAVFKCDGPFFRVFGEADRGVCPHVCEIGD